MPALTTRVGKRAAECVETEQQNQADEDFWCRPTLTNDIYLANTSRHEDLDRSYCGGNAHGQDGVTVRRQPPMRGKTGSSKGPFFMPSIWLGGAAGKNPAANGPRQ